MNHKEKVKLARKLQTNEELREKGKGIFESIAWESRKARIMKEVLLRRKNK